MNKIFYPWACVDSELAADYWFIDLYVGHSPTEPDPVSMEGILFDTTIDTRFTEFGSTAEAVLERLCLWDWEESWRDSPEKTINYASQSGWSRFTLPFVITVDSDFRQPPPRQPEIVPLSRVPDFDEESQENGERLQYDRVIELTDFVTFMNRVGTWISEARSIGDLWRFLNVALGFLVKAFFSRDHEEQLWHITAEFSAALAIRSNSWLFQGETKTFLRVCLVLARHCHSSSGPLSSRSTVRILPSIVAKAWATYCFTTEIWP